MPHAFDGRGYLVGRGVADRPHELHYVNEVGEHLAVIGRRPFVVAAVGQDLCRQLAG